MQVSHTQTFRKSKVKKNKNLAYVEEPEISTLGGHVAELAKLRDELRAKAIEEEKKEKKEKK